MKQTKNTAESHRLEIYVLNVHHSREHMHSNNYAHCTIADGFSDSVQYWCYAAALLGTRG